ncbi:hypothetical protein Micbo1qcDRAFT_167090, partial [Microdochium bolleyi]
MVRLLLEHERRRGGGGGDEAGSRRLEDSGDDAVAPRLVECRTLPPRGLTPLMFLLARARHTHGHTARRKVGNVRHASLLSSSSSSLASSSLQPPPADDGGSLLRAGCAEAVQLLLASSADVVTARSLGVREPRSMLYFAAARGCYACKRAVLVE